MKPINHSNGNPSSLPFSYEEGLEVQQKDLLKWKGFLAPGIYGALEKWCQEQNAKIVNPGDIRAGYGVPRGQTLTEFVTTKGLAMSESPAIREGVDPEPDTRSIFTLARLKAVCPSCGAGLGESCRSPSGRVYDPPHGARIAVYRKALSPEEFRLRHTI